MGEFNPFSKMCSKYIAMLATYVYHESSKTCNLTVVPVSFTAKRDLDSFSPGNDKLGLKINLVNLGPDQPEVKVNRICFAEKLENRRDNGYPV